ncbi:MAG: FadR/GntR family transcriptional regulator [Paracoccaceae bacterium]
MASETSETPAKPQTRLDFALDYIKDKIADGTLTAGVRLPAEVDLAREIGVSRTPVREAIKVLAAAGVLDVRHGHGTFIAKGPQASLAQLLLFQIHMKASTPQKLMEVRLIFERSCAELAAERRTPEDLATMRECIERLRALTEEAVPDLDAITEADLDFHRAVYHASHNELVASIANFALNMVAGWLRKSHGIGEVRNTVRLHEVMYTMIETRNSGGARECYGVEANMEDFRRNLEQLEVKGAGAGVAAQ